MESFLFCFSCLIVFLVLNWKRTTSFCLKYSKHIKAYILWFLVGGLGIHAFYCKKSNWGLFTLLTWLLAISFMMFDGGVMMFVHIMNVLVQAFLIPLWVKETALIEKAIKKARGEDATNNEKP